MFKTCLPNQRSPSISGDCSALLVLSQPSWATIPLFSQTLQERNVVTALLMKLDPQTRAVG